MKRLSPGEVELSAFYSLYTGPRFEIAGVRIQFHYNKLPGVHFKTEIPEEYQSVLLKGIQEGMKLRFPLFPEHGSIWITHVTIDDTYSSQRSFYRVGRMFIDQAFSLIEITSEHD